MYCKNCGRQIDDNAYLCIHCGVRVQDEPSSKDEPARYCARCGKQIDPHAYICVHCGERTGYTGQNNGTAFAKIKVIPENQSRAPLVLAILAIVFTFIGLRLVGAVLAIIGMTLALYRHDKKNIKVNIASLIVNAAMSIIAILVGLLG